MLRSFLRALHVVCAIGVDANNSGLENRISRGGPHHPVCVSKESLSYPRHR